VCLNSLLYKTEMDLEQMGRMLGKTAEAEECKKQAAARKKAIQKYLWNGEKGKYFDYDFVKQKVSTYEYATIFYPLWLGIPSKGQAAAVVKTLGHFEKRGGIMMSPYDTGTQWDAPFSWAPVQLVDVEGVRRYGFVNEANRTSYEFLSTVAENFRKAGTIREKYNAVDRSNGRGGEGWLPDQCGGIRVDERSVPGIPERIADGNGGEVGQGAGYGQGRGELEADPSLRSG
jgi:alpha,alpha-trehalase